MASNSGNTSEKKNAINFYYYRVRCTVSRGVPVRLPANGKHSPAQLRKGPLFIQPNLLLCWNPAHLTCLICIFSPALSFMNFSAVMFSHRWEALELLPLCRWYTDLMKVLPCSANEYSINARGKCVRYRFNFIFNFRTDASLWTARWVRISGYTACEMAKKLPFGKPKRFTILAFERARTPTYGY